MGMGSGALLYAGWRPMHLAVLRGAADNQAQERETGVISSKGRTGARIDFVLDDSNATAVFGEGCSSPDDECSAYVEVLGERIAEFDLVIEHNNLPAPVAEFFSMAAKDADQ